MTVEFGLALENFTPATKVPDMDAVSAYSVTAEELGFASVWAWDHLFLGARRPFPFLEALTTLSMVAARTSRIMLGTGILVLPIREPAILVTRRSKGSSRPASVMIPKNRMAKTNMPATGAISEMPATMNLAVCKPKPAASAPATGTRINAAMGERRLSRIAASRPQITNMPTVTSMVQRQVKLAASVISPLPL